MNITRRTVLKSALATFPLLATSRLFGAENNATTQYPDRWFYASANMESDESVTHVTELIERAGKNGLNGILLACGLDSYYRWSDKRKANFEKVKTVANRSGVEIIPILWTVGYGTMLGENMNLAEGLEVTDIPFKACYNNDKLEAVCQLDGKNIAVNPSFEEVKGKPDALQPVGFDFVDAPGERVCIDNEVKFSGSRSVRIQKYELDEHRHARIMQTIPVTPHRLYCVTLRYKAQNYGPNGTFRFQAYTFNGSGLTNTVPPIGPDGNQDWTEARLFFNSGSQTKIRIYAGSWGGVTGHVWMDELTVTELGMVNALDRPGTPITVRNSDTGEVYERGRDFQLPQGYKPRWSLTNTQSIKLEIPNGSRIHDGDKLLVSYYHLNRINNSQTTVCMSEPELYEHFKTSAKGVMEALAPKKWFLSMDEIRAGGSCKACKDRHLSLGQILGDCITKQYNIIQSVQPNAQVYIWSDMLDPNHNAHGDYFNCVGDFTGSWDYIPKELIISCWYHKIREESLKFFSSRGFRTLAAAYYDTDNLDTCRDWLEAINHTPHCTGIMYTSWRNKYDLLVPFAELIREESKGNRE